MNTYHISLGGSCGPALKLKKRELRNQAFPFDFVVSSFEWNVNLLLNDFENYFATPYMKQDNILIGKKIRQVYIDTQNKITYPHHFQEFDNINKLKETMLRRVNRLMNILNNKNNKIIFYRTRRIFRTPYQKEIYEKYFGKIEKIEEENFEKNRINFEKLLNKKFSSSIIIKEEALY